MLHGAVWSLEQAAAIGTTETGYGSATFVTCLNWQCTGLTNGLYCTADCLQLAYQPEYRLGWRDHDQIYVAWKVFGERLLNDHVVR